MKVDIKYFYTMFIVMIMGMLCADSFIIKKAKEVVIPYKDQAIASIVDFLSWSPTLMGTQGNAVTKIAQLQEEMMKIVQSEFEGKEHSFSERSASDHKNIRNATQKIQDQCKSINQQISQLSKNIDIYIQTLRSNSEQLKENISDIAYLAK